MSVGNTIIQQICIPPFNRLSQKIICGVSVSNIIRQPAKIGFSYETLEGHVEKGISIFTVEEIEKAKLIFKIETRSTPTIYLVKMLSPFFPQPIRLFVQGLP